jgi:hypothetical protein
MHDLRIMMDKETAANVVQALLDGGSRLASTVDDVRGKMPEEEFKRYAKALGEVLASIQLDLMASIIREHPELDPDR